MEPIAQEAENRPDDFDQTALEQTTQPFVGRWNQLVSQTNWEKGRIIQQWRDALIAADAPGAEYADEAWSRHVGSVTGQHVGRLRRVYQRFGQSREQFEGLFWSHFQAALDWDDAEMWLEGALQNRWSVSRMRQHRWETLGAVADQAPSDSDIITSELDEDLEHGLNDPPISSNDFGESSPRDEGPDFADGDVSSEARAASEMDRDLPAAELMSCSVAADAAEFVRPFSEIGDLPDDLAQAFEALKLAILHHKMDQWKEIPCDDLLAALDALKLLATAPSDDTAPF